MPPGADVGSSPEGQPGGTGQESLSNGDDGAPLGRELEIARLLKAIKDHGVKNVVFLTGDVHYLSLIHI